LNYIEQNNSASPPLIGKETKSDLNPIAPEFKPSKLSKEPLHTNGKAQSLSTLLNTSQDSVVAPDKNKTKKFFSPVGNRKQGFPSGDDIERTNERSFSVDFFQQSTLLGSKDSTISNSMNNKVTQDSNAAEEAFMDRFG
jgi:hypothetical protein